MCKKLVILIAGALLFTAMASADLVPIGDPIESGSWSQLFRESDVGSFDFMAIRMTSSDLFGSPAMSELATGWVNTDVTSMRSYAEGPAATDMTFRISFAGDQSDPLVFEFFAFNGTTLLEAANVSWSGSGWTITASSSSPTRDDLTMIPLPGAALLGVIGLGTIGWIRRRLS